MLNPKNIGYTLAGVAGAISTANLLLDDPIPSQCYSGFLKIPVEEKEQDNFAKWLGISSPLGQTPGDIVTRRLACLKAKNKLPFSIRHSDKLSLLHKTVLAASGVLLWGGLASQSPSYIRVGIACFPLFSDLLLKTMPESLKESAPIVPKLTEFFSETGVAVAYGNFAWSSFKISQLKNSYYLFALAWINFTSTCMKAPMNFAHAIISIDAPFDQESWNNLYHEKFKKLTPEDIKKLDSVPLLPELNLYNYLCRMLIRNVDNLNLKTYTLPGNPEEKVKEKFLLDKIPFDDFSRESAITKSRNTPSITFSNRTDTLKVVSISSCRTRIIVKTKENSFKEEEFCLFNSDKLNKLNKWIRDNYQYNNDKKIFEFKESPKS